jgi:selenocysteine lyase/cysteine desulfurase
MTGEATAPLPCQRAQFDLPPDVVYLNAAFMGPRLRAVGEAGAAALARTSEPWTLEAADWFAGPERLRAVAARLLGADADDVALVPAVSYGIAIAAANLPLERGQRIVVLDEQFPSNVYAWRDMARASGAELRTVRKEPHDAWTDAVVEAIDEDTAIVAVPNGHWTDGALVELERVGERARAVGAALVVDASQSFGAYPLDVAAVRPDFLVSVGYKWQLGPYGLGYLYVDPKRRNGRPLEASWAARAGAEDFAGLVRYADAYRAGARRFDMGEFAQFQLGPMALAALTQIEAWGVARIQAALGALTARVAEGAAALGCDVLAAERRLDHLVGLRFPGGIPRELPRRLAAERIFVSVRGDAIRVAPHVHNHTDDAERLLAVLRATM